VVSRVAVSVGRARAAVRAHPRWRWFALVVVASGMMLSVVNVSIVNIALPAMADDLDVDVASVGWVVSGFLITQATMLPTSGRAGDLFGRRRVFLAGIALVCVSSVLCAVAWDIRSLIAFRVLQGVGASTLAPTAFSYATELFSPAERGTAMGVLGGVLGLAPVLALTLAGVLVEAAGWRSVFWFSPAIGVLVLAGAVLVLDERRRPPRPAGAASGFDVPGAALAGAALVGLLLALSRGGAWGWTSAATLAALGVAVLAAALFVRRERVAPDPMMDLGLFRLRSLRTANLAGGASAAALFGTTVVLPFYLGAVEGLSPVGLALAISPVALCFVVVSPVAGRAMARGLVPSHALAATGMGIAAAGALWMALNAERGSYPWTLPGMLALGTGLAMSTAPVTTTALSEVPVERLGVAASLPNICRYTGAGFGVAALGAALAAALPAGAADPGAVAEGFRGSMLLAVAFLVTGALIALRMPRQASARRPGVPT
jgi:EmrB/QacA subfamily drug resistance transporter